VRFQRAQPAYKQYAVRIGNGDTYHMPNRAVAETFLAMWTKAPHQEDAVLVSCLPGITEWAEEPTPEAAAPAPWPTA
jgi:hypothetical protein